MGNKYLPLNIPIVTGEQLVERIASGKEKGMSLEDARKSMVKIKAELIEKVGKMSCSDTNKRTSVVIENGTITIQTRLKAGPRKTEISVKDYFDKRLTVPLNERRCVIHAIEKQDRELGFDYGALIFFEETVGIMEALGDANKEAKE